MDYANYWASAIATADLGEPIDQSLRFIGGIGGSGNGGYLSRAITTSSTTAALTISFWVKLGSIPSGYSRFIFSSGTAGSASGNISYDMGSNEAYIRFQDTSSYTAFTTQKLRDFSAWYHIVYRFDAANQYVKVYVNGSEHSSTSIATSARTSYGATSPMQIGRYADSSYANNYWDGYLAEWNMLFGTSLGPDSFGRTNDDGVWVPISLSSLTSNQYGALGNRLIFDSSAGLGDDTAPTGGTHASANDFTASGFDTAAISSSNEDNDIDYLDTPTNNYATLNPLLGRSASLNFEHANLRQQFGAGGSHCGMAGFGMPGSSGKYYWEVTLKVQKEGGIGIVSEDFDLEAGNTSFGTDTANGGQGWEWIVSEGRRDNNNVETNTSHTVPNVGDTIGFLLDTDAGTCTIEINGVAQTSGNGAEYTNIPTDKTIYPYFRLGGASGDANLDWNFGQMAFQHEPTGYQDLATNNLPEPTIKNGKEHFGILTYAAPASPSFPITIDGSGGNNGDGELDFDGQPDFVWMKMRNGSQNNILFDRVNGVTKSLRSDGNITEVATRTNFAFATNGFTFSAQDAETYQQNDNYVAWCWKAGGTAVSNTNGTITSSVSANTDAGFSIVSYTGNSTSGATIGHGLSSAPECIFTKNRDTTADWAVYHVAQDATAPQNKYMALNTSDATATASDRWNNTAPTSTLFTVGDAVQTNGADVMTAYCWHSVAGYSKFGSYTGNGSADGSYVELGFKPAFILLKSSTNAFDWQIYDSTRSANNPATLTLRPNLGNAEVTSGNDLDILSNGFKARDNGSINNNSGSTYVYMAFAESPFGGENAPPATAR